MIYEAVTSSPNLEGSLLVFGALLLALMMFFSYRTGQKVYNLFAIGVCVFLAMLLSTHIPLVIVFIGLIIFLLADAFLGWNT